MQVMWLKSVANKLLRKPVGTDALLEGATFDEFINPNEPQKDQIDTRKYKYAPNLSSLGFLSNH